MRKRTPPAHGQYREPRPLVELGDQRLAEDREDEAWNRNTEDDEEQRGPIRRPSARDGGNRPKEDPTEGRVYHCQDAKRCRNREVSRDDIVHRAVLLGERYPEVSPGHIRKK